MKRTRQLLIYTVFLCTVCCFANIIALLSLNFFGALDIKQNNKLNSKRSDFLHKRSKSSSEIRNSVDAIMSLDLDTRNVFEVPKVSFLQDYKSPCFFEQRPGAISRKDSIERQLTFPGGKFLRCMPHFMLAGETNEFTFKLSDHNRAFQHRGVV